MESERAICTIIAKNYVAYARTLCESYLALHPGDRCFVLVVDDHRGFIDPAEEAFELVGVEELGIQDFYHKFVFKYNVTELSTAVKPYLLELLLRRRGVDKLLYIDPDILVLHRLDRLFESLDRSDIVLTPHLDADYPDDGKMPNDSATMQVGMFNLGFIGVNSGDNAARFLRWWQGKLYDKCVIDFPSGYFVDQKFLDLALFLFEGIHVEKDTGYNVAIHNLHSRRLGVEGGRWTCNGRPLYFYHFCGFDYGDRKRICKYYDNVRYDLDNRPDLAPLYADYTERVRANGQEVVSQWPYTYGCFDNGEPILDAFRKRYRDSPGLRTECADPFDYESFRRHCPEFKSLMARSLLEKTYKAIAGGNYRTAMARLREACGYDPSLAFSSEARSYTKWAAKLWLRDQSLRPSNGRRAGRG